MYEHSKPSVKLLIWILKNHSLLTKTAKVMAMTHNFSKISADSLEPFNRFQALKSKAAPVAKGFMPQ